MTKTNLPIFVLAVSYLGTLASFVTEAKSLIGALAALASLIASLYAIALTRRRLKKLRRIDPNPFRKSAASVKSAVKSPRTLRPSRSSRLKNHVALFVIFVSFCGLSGCATHARARADKALTQSNERLAEESRALTTAVVDSLSSIAEATPAGTSPLAANPSPLAMARRFALADQEIEGLPLQRIPVIAALAGDTNAVTAIDARLNEIASLRAHNSQLAQALRERDAALMELGAQYEAEKSKSLWRRIKTAIAGALGLGGLIALCVFCPAIIPILTRALAWIVGKIPQLAGALGVVGKDAFDAVVKGVGRAREELKTRDTIALASLDANLKTETDSAHKALINQRRAALNV